MAREPITDEQVPCWMVGSHLLREKSSLNICEAKEPERIFNFLAMGFKHASEPSTFMG